MCGNTHLCADVPETTVTLIVTYCHKPQAWHGQICSHSTLADGEYIHHGHVIREFGPFDNQSDVLQWAYREASALIRLAPSRASTEP